MYRTGLCGTCDYGRHCVLNDEQAVWDCQEFYANGVLGQASAKIVPAQRAQNERAEETSE